MLRVAFRTNSNLSKQLVVAIIAGFLTVFINYSDISAQGSPPPMQLNGTGLSDILLIDIAANGDLGWSYLDSSSGYTSKVAISGAAAFGKNGDHLAVGPWHVGGSNQIGYISSTADGVSWTVRTGLGDQSVQFGAAGNLALISGADFDGDGVYDFARIENAGGVYVKLNPFSNAPVDLERKFAPKVIKRTEKAFFVRTSLGRDGVGVLESMPKAKNRYRIRVVDPISGQKFTKVLTKKIPGKIVEVAPISRPNGSQSVLVVSKRPGGKHRVAIYNLNTGAREFQRVTVSQIPFLVGKYQNEAGEQIAFKRGSELVFMAPYSGGQESAVPLQSGVLADHININAFSGGGDNGGGDPGQGGSGVGGACSSIQPLPSAFIYKTVGSHHFSDCRRTTAGLIVKAGFPGSFPSSSDVIDTSGNVRATFGAYYPPGAQWKWRAYACWGAGENTPYSGAKIASDAKAATGSPNVYLRVGTQCYGPIDAGKCYNSSSC